MAESQIPLKFLDISWWRTQQTICRDHKAVCERRQVPPVILSSYDLHSMVMNLLYCTYCTAIIVLHSLHCIFSLHFLYCTNCNALIVVLLLYCTYCISLIVLNLLYCKYFTKLIVLHLSYCTAFYSYTFYSLLVRLEPYWNTFIKLNNEHCTKFHTDTRNFTLFVTIATSIVRTACTL